MLESYTAGVDFMAPDRGCIAERIRRPDRLLTGDEGVDAARILLVLERAAADWDTARRACNRHAVDLHAGAVREAALVFDAMFAPH